MLLRPRRRLAALASMAAVLAIAAALLAPGWRASADTLTVCAGGGCQYGTLTAAIASLGQAIGPHVIELQTGDPEPGTVVIDLQTGVTIQGLGVGATVLDGGGAHGLIEVLSGSLTIEGVTLTGGATAENGGAIRATAPLTLIDAAFVGNTAGVRGGAVHASSTLDVSGTTFSDNTAGDDGGAIYAAGATTIAGSVFDGNAAGSANDDRGGALYAAGPTTIDASRFEANSAWASGAIETINEFHVTASVFDGNTSTAGGKAIDRPGVASGAASVRGSAFLGHATPAVDASVAISVASTWWGDPDGPAAGALGGAATSTSHLTGITVVPSDATPSVGDSVTLTVTPTLNTGVFGEAFEVSVARTGTNVDTATAAGTGTVAPQYAGSAGEDSIIATMLWGGEAASTSLASAPATVTWSVAPVADAGGPYAASEGDSVAFDGSASTGDAERTYAWDFGDGGTSTEVEPEHTYVHDATYEVTLTVTNPDESTDVATVDAVIANVAPSVDAGANTSVALGAAVEVSATFSDAGALDAPWAWVIDWGDGSADATGTTDEAGAAIVRSHTYGAAGQRSVTVCVTDKDAGEGCDTRTVQVTAPPEPPPEEIETPVATPTPTPSATPTPTPTATPAASPTPAATPASTPTATPTAAATPSPTPPPASTPAATPAPTSTATPPPPLPLPASTPPPGAGSGATPAPTPVTPTAPATTPSVTPTPDATPVPLSLEGGTAAGLLAAVDTSRTPGGREVSPEVAETRAQVRKVATVGAAFTGGTLPWYAMQSIDQRAVAGALVSGGAFLPFVFGGGPGAGSGGGGPAGGPTSSGGPGTDAPQARREDEDRG